MSLDVFDRCVADSQLSRHSGILATHVRHEFRTLHNQFFDVASYADISAKYALSANTVGSPKNRRQGDFY